MTTTTSTAGRRPQDQQGAAAVEFAVVAAVFFTLLIGIAEMGRLMWTWNAAAEATRRGARLAVVCSMNDANIKTHMREMLPALANSNISIDYLDPPNAPNTCTTATCKEVSVRLSGYTHQSFIPFVPLSVPLPPFQTTLPREFMESTGNPVCN
ncbi:pilus assembly protein [Dechloromonas sp. XY25]|uniref:Pilus assembly protein n=1 Tax=Dechloromonas hankyongensis TaxID=2908002 RepID=A0ABS9JZY1_9RHOO|nr:TadE/TadG family type IV pilus assembly protein [Dechloromonas hankyongensis]MCG2576461.1 pilus assembly protein [Dechloromonas hankyongensis]